MTNDELRKLCARAAKYLRYPHTNTHTVMTELMEELEAAGRADQQEAREDALAARNIGLELSCDELKARIAELEQQMLALREASKDMLSGWRYIRDSHGDLYGVGWDRAQGKVEQTLTDTAQAGRQAEAQVLERWANDQASRLPPENDRTDVAHHAAHIYQRMLRDANRLRNGGSDSE